MVAALYRRYRPETFAEMIGQQQVTDPLSAAIRAGRVNHAYLFSGPRGCGKTTSARILARCLNCHEGPTPEPCGVCPSCVELARDGGGSLDVVEIDAASHGGVDDARDLRDRAVIAPSRDRYKVFIIDEAHMVSREGFNALLKLVEEPPDHVRFVFATTEPERVLGTIRSRTHHYAFRLIPPATMLAYLQQICAAEGIEAEDGVLQLVVRAGGGSARDTLSVLDQLIGGTEGETLRYDQAIGLLGYTDSALLDRVIDALAAGSPHDTFLAADQVIETGADPRRFVEDLLERLRDLILVAATRDEAETVLRGLGHDQIATLRHEAQAYGAGPLSRAADIVNRALTAMSGATSPRIHLELMMARLLAAQGEAAGQAESGRQGQSTAPEQSAQRAVERPAATVPSAVGSSAPAAPAASQPAQTRTEPQAPSKAQTPSAPQPAVGSPAPAGAPTPAGSRPASEPQAPSNPQPAPQPEPRSAQRPEAQTPAEAPVLGSGALPDLEGLRARWRDVLRTVGDMSQGAAEHLQGSIPVTFDGDHVLRIAFSNQHRADTFGHQPGIEQPTHEVLRRALLLQLGTNVKFHRGVVRDDVESAPSQQGEGDIDTDGGAASRSADTAEASSPQPAREPAPAHRTSAPDAEPWTSRAPAAKHTPASKRPDIVASGWATVAIPSDDEDARASADSPTAAAEEPDAPAQDSPPASSPVAPSTQEFSASASASASAPAASASVEEPVAAEGSAIAPAAPTAVREDARSAARDDAPAAMPSAQPTGDTEYEHTDADAPDDADEWGSGEDDHAEFEVEGAEPHDDDEGPMALLGGGDALASSPRAAEPVVGETAAVDNEQPVIADVPWALADASGPWFDAARGVTTAADRQASKHDAEVANEHITAVSNAEEITRYGESVVRSVLGARFLREERESAPMITMRDEHGAAGGTAGEGGQGNV